MVVDFIKIEPMMSNKISSSNKKIISTVRPTPLNKPIQSMANHQQQQIIVIPGNMLLGKSQNGQATATMEQVKSILKLATSQNQQCKTTTIVTSSNNTKTLTSGAIIGANKTPVVLPTLMKSTPSNAAIVRPVNGTHKTAIVSPQQQVVQGSPRVISLKRQYSAITCAKPTEVTEQPNIIRLCSSSHIQGLSSFTTEHIKLEEDDEMSESGQAAVRKRANLDHMSSEEKMMRRKLKNRVAAQNARDKKRVKMDDMDDRIKRLEDENKRMQDKQQELIKMNHRLIKENEMLTGKPSQKIIEPTSFIKVEPQTFEDMELSQNRVLYVPPMSPESLPRSPSPSSSISSSTMTQHQRLSSLDTDDESPSSLSSIVTSDSSDLSSLVEQRSVEPAEPIKFLQQQDLDRRLAGEEMCKSQQETNSLLDPSTTALFWTCLMTTVLPVINNLSSQDKKMAPVTSSKEHLEPLDSSTLPPKKRMSHAAVLHPPSEEKRLPT